jgi:hypothetical protein
VACCTYVTAESLMQNSYRKRQMATSKIRYKLSNITRFKDYVSDRKSAYTNSKQSLSQTFFYYFEKRRYVASVTVYLKNAYRHRSEPSCKLIRLDLNIILLIYRIKKKKISAIRFLQRTSFKQIKRITLWSSFDLT